MRGRGDAKFDGARLVVQTPGRGRWPMALPAGPRLSTELARIAGTCQLLANRFDAIPGPLDPQLGGPALGGTRGSALKIH